MLTDLRSILALAEEKGCAIPAFNCYTQECVMGVLEAAKETGAPVIFQMFSRLADTNDGNFVAPAILEAIRQMRAEVGRDNCLYIHVTLVPYLNTARVSQRLFGPSVSA